MLLKHFLLHQKPFVLSVKPHEEPVPPLWPPTGSHPIISPCSWWWRCRTPHCHCHDIRWVWSRPPPWSPPSAPCWPNAASGTATPPPLSAAPSPIPPVPSPPGQSHLAHLKHGQCTTVLSSFDMDTDGQEHPRPYTETHWLTHTHSHTLNSTGAGRFFGPQAPFLSATVCVNSWIDNMGLVMKLVSRFLNRFNKILPFW